MDDDEVNALEGLTAEMHKAIEAMGKRMKAVEQVVTGVDDIDDFDTLTRAQLHKIANGTGGIRGRAGREPTHFDDQKGRTTDLKALADFARSGPDRIMRPAQNILREDIDPDGGYTVTPALSPTMTKRIFDQSPFRRLARVVPISTAEFVEIIDMDDVGAEEWVSEIQDRAETAAATLGKITIPAGECYALQPISQNLLEDSNINLGQWIETKVADKFARVEGKAFLTADGAGKKPTGFLTLDTDTAVDITRDKQKLQRVEAAQATAVAVNELTDLFWALRAVHRTNATWLMNSATANKIDKLKDGSGEPLWRNGMTAGAPNSLLGRPVEFDENMPAMTSGNFPIAFGDWYAGYTIVDRLGVSWLRDPYTRPGVVKFYGRRRTGGAVMNTDAIKLLKMGA